MSLLVSRAAAFATKAHAGQRRKFNDEPYIAHPARVAAMVSDPSIVANQNVIAAAWLHDVMEDCGVTFHALANEFGPYTAWLVDALTHRDDPSVNRADRKRNEADRLALFGWDVQTIKYADVIDNTASIAANDPEFASVYLPEMSYLLDRCQDGHQPLWRKAMDAVTLALWSQEGKP